MAISLLEMKAAMPDPFRAGIVSMLWENSRIMPLLNFIEHNGLTYPYSQLAKLPGISFRSLNNTFNDSQSVINPAAEFLAVMGGRIKADTVLDAVKPNFRQNEVMRQLEAAAKFWDKSFIIGDPAVIPNSFLGLRARIAGAQLLNPTAGANSPITSDDVVRLQDAVEGPNTEKVLLMNQTLRRNLSHDVSKSAGGKQIFVGADTTTQQIGIQVGAMGSKWQRFNDSPVVEVYYDEAELPILPFTETSNTSSVYCFRPGNAVDERYVQGISGLAGQNHFQVRGPIDFGEYLITVIQGLFGIGVFSGYGVARLQGLNATPS